MKPFDLEKALSGEPVITRNGRPAIIKEAVRNRLGTLVYGDVDGSNYAWYTDGLRGIMQESSLDLFMAEKQKLRKVGWVHVWSNSDATYSDFHETEESAINAVKHENKRGVVNSLSIQKIEWEEEA
jgi:hypothetical protein